MANSSPGLANQHFSMILGLVNSISKVSFVFLLIISNIQHQLVSANVISGNAVVVNGDTHGKILFSRTKWTSAIVLNSYMYFHELSRIVAATLWSASLIEVKEYFKAWNKCIYFYIWSVKVLKVRDQRLIRSGCLTRECVSYTMADAKSRNDHE